VTVNSAECHQVDASCKIRIYACCNWPSRYGLLVHPVIKDEALWTVSAQITPAAINRGLRSNPKSPFASAAISLLLAHIIAISFGSVNLYLGFLRLDPWPLPIRKCSRNPLHMRAKSGSWSIIISFLTARCSNGDWQMGKISLHQIPTRLWCYLPFFNVDSAYPLANSSAASLITMRSS
jgi:hypothetical protein